MPDGHAIVPMIPAKIDFAPVARLQGTHHVGNLPSLGGVFQGWWRQWERLWGPQRGVTKPHEASLTHDYWHIHCGITPPARRQAVKLRLAQRRDRFPNAEGQHGILEVFG